MGLAQVELCTMQDSLPHLAAGPDTDRDLCGFSTVLDHVWVERWLDLEQLLTQYVNVDGCFAQVWPWSFVSLD